MVFRYSQIETWEIDLPSLIVELKSPPPFVQCHVNEELKAFSKKGYEVYAKIYDKLALISSDVEHPMMSTLKTILNRDQIIFRSLIEKVQTIMTESIVSFYDVHDAMLHVKRALAESIETWGPRLHEAALQQNQINSRKSDTHSIDSGQICTEDLLNDNDDYNRGDDDKKENIDSMSIDSTNHLETKDENNLTSDKTKDFLDKKGIRNILSQIIPSVSNHNNSIQSPLPSNEYHCLPIGLMPILVCDQDLSSIIAYSLVSNDYIKAIDTMTSGYVSDTNNSPHLKRKSQDIVTTDDKESSSSNDKEKKSNSHITINFQDSTTNFSCKIYFGKEFDQLRTSFLCPPKSDKLKESDNSFKTKRDSDANDNNNQTSFDRKSSSSSLNSTKAQDTMRGNSGIGCNDKSFLDIDEIRRSFVRSLSQSNRWDARGGKSGFNFSKTIDDRFILKEMSKQDVTIFENFAPNYFEYLNQCLIQNQPTLLAKIFGVFRVIIRKKE